MIKNSTLPMSIRRNHCLKFTFYSYRIKAFFKTKSWQTIHFTIQLTGYFFHVIVKLYGLIDKALNSSRDCGSILHVVMYDLANKKTIFLFFLFNKYLITIYIFKTSMPYRSKKIKITHKVWTYYVPVSYHIDKCHQCSVYF